MKKIALFFCALILTACSSVPSKMYFSPQPVISQNRIYQGQQYIVAVKDDRRAKHLLEIIDKDGKRQRRPAGNVIEQQLSAQLRKGFSRQGLSLDDYSPASIELSVIQLETVLSQQSLQYEASFAVEFKVTVRKGGKSYFKTFTGHNSRKGVFQSDVAALEQELNSLAATVLSNIFNDSYIQQSIRA